MENTTTYVSVMTPDGPTNVKVPNGFCLPDDSTFTSEDARALKRRTVVPEVVPISSLPPGLREYAARRQAARDAGESVPEEYNEEELALMRAARERARTVSGL